MREAITSALELAQELDGYETFRRRYYAECLLPGIAAPDSRETVPVALALFYLAGGDPERTIIYGANFGRDADTIASMAGALAGAYRGVDALPDGWVAKVRAESPRAHDDVARELVEVVARRIADLRDQVGTFSRLL
jgi:ADP-ribosylglycohydrolase